MNWYKTSQTETIEAIAQRVRAEMVTCYDDKCLKALCLPTSRALKKALIEAGYADAMVVQGVFKVDNPDPDSYTDWDVNDFENEEEMESDKYTPLHYWVEVRNQIVDLTGSQFQDEVDGSISEITIGAYQQMPRYIPIVKDW